MSNLCEVDIQLNAIRSFLKTVLNAADSEYSRVHDRSNSGDFIHYDDQENAMYFPMMWEEIGCRATLGELNALIEWELLNIACIAQVHLSKMQDKEILKLISILEIEKPKTPKDILHLISKLAESPKYRLKLKRDEAILLISIYYQIRMKEINSYGALKTIINKVNSFKHRKGFKDPYKNEYKAIPERFDTSRTDTMESIVLVRRFLKDLFSKTIHKHKARQV